MIDEENSGIRARVASMICNRTPLAMAPDDLVREIIRWANRAASPQPMETAPPGDGHILGLVNDAAPFAASRPWAVLSRCDDGWEDDRGIVRKPTAWIALPDPQPEPTGWRPAEGTIEVCAAEGLNWDWKGWLVNVVRPDGTHDADREPFYLDSAKVALRVASEQGLRLGLTVSVGVMEHKAEGAVIIPFRGRETLQ